jgi:hypothetical protein
MTNLGIGHNGGPPLEELEVVRVRVLPDGRLGRKNAARYLRRSPKTLAQWALHGKGPPSHDIGGRAFYYLKECDAFIAGRDSSPPATPSPAPAPRRRGRAYGVLKLSAMLACSGPPVLDRPGRCQKSRLLLAPSHFA